MKFIIFFICFIPAITFGQYVSLKSDDVIDDIPIEFKVGEDIVKEAVTVIKSSASDLQWYYIPNKPRLYQRDINGKSIPEFTLLSYIINNPKNNSKLVDGGILQFTSTMQIPDESIQAIKKEIERRKGIQGISLSSLPIKSAEVNLYAPIANTGSDSLSLFTSSPKGSGVAPIFATQTMAFTVPLSSVGTDVIDALANTNTGIAVVYNFSYYGIAKAGFSVKVDFKQLYSHYSKNEKFAAKASYLGLFGASYQQEKLEVYQELKNSSCISIEINPGENLTEKEIVEQFISPILSEINKQVLENSKIPQVISPASASDPNASGAYFSAGYSVSTKQLNINTLNTQEIKFDVNQLIERKTLASAFIGIGNFSEDIKKKLVLSITESKHKIATFTTPPVLDASLASKLGISRVGIEIIPIVKNRKLQSYVRYWDSKSPDVWQGSNCDPCNVFTYGWYKEPTTDEEMKANKFEIITTINHNGPTIINTETESFDPRQRLLDAIYDAKFDAVSIDASQLSFNSLISTSNLFKVIAKVHYNGVTKTYDNIIPSNKNNLKAPPEILYYPVGLNEANGNNNSVTVDISFVMKDGKVVPWKNNGKNLRELSTGLSINLFDEDWK